MAFEVFNHITYAPTPAKAHIGNFLPNPIKSYYMIYINYIYINYMINTSKMIEEKRFS